MPEKFVLSEQSENSLKCIIFLPSGQQRSYERGKDSCVGIQWDDMGISVEFISDDKRRTLSFNNMPYMIEGVQIAS